MAGLVRCNDQEIKLCGMCGRMPIVRQPVSVMLISCTHCGLHTSFMAKERCIDSWNATAAEYKTSAMRAAKGGE